MARIDTTKRAAKKQPAKKVAVKKRMTLAVDDETVAKLQEAEAENSDVGTDPAAG
jgi:hypothetical protein